MCCYSFRVVLKDAKAALSDSYHVVLALSAMLSSQVRPTGSTWSVAVYMSSHPLSSSCPPHTPPPPTTSRNCCDMHSLWPCNVQSALRDAAKQDDKQGVLAIAKKANDLYKQQQEIQKRADQRYSLDFESHCSMAYKNMCRVEDQGQGADSFCLFCCIIKGPTVWRLSNIKCTGHSCTGGLSRGGGGG